jgi:hypothetical protein
VLVAEARAHADATVVRACGANQLGEAQALSHLSALAARETKTRQRSSRGIFFTTPAPPALSPAVSECRSVEQCRGSVGVSGQCRGSVEAVSGQGVRLPIDAASFGK